LPIRSFHAEKASRNMGKDLRTKIFEGNLSAADWSALDGILESDGLSELNVRPDLYLSQFRTPIFFTISVKREDGFQNMEFYERQQSKAL